MASGQKIDRQLRLADLIFDHEKPSISCLGWLFTLLALLLCNTARAEDSFKTLASGLQFAEGTIFVGDTLYLVDYSASDVLRLNKGKLERVWHLDGCGANGLLRVPEGLLVACYDGNSVQSITLDGKAISRITHDDAGVSFEAPNDFAADGNGGIYITASGAAATSGRVFYRSASGALRVVASNLSFANGVGVSPDGRTLYVTESTAGRVDSMSIAANGSLGPVEVIADLAKIIPGATPGRVAPDSLRVDRSGHVYVALYRGGGVAVLDAAGKLLRHIDVPGEHHTTLALSPDGRSMVVTAVDDVAGGYSAQLLESTLDVH